MLCTCNKSISSHEGLFSNLNSSQWVCRILSRIVLNLSLLLFEYIARSRLTFVVASSPINIKQVTYKEEMFDMLSEQYYT